MTSGKPFPSTSAVTAMTPAVPANGVNVGPAVPPDPKHGNRAPLGDGECRHLALVDLRGARGRRHPRGGGGRHGRRERGRHAVVVLGQRDRDSVLAGIGVGVLAGDGVVGRGGLAERPPLRGDAVERDGAGGRGAVAPIDGRGQVAQGDRRRARELVLELPGEGDGNPLLGAAGATAAADPDSESAWRIVAVPVDVAVYVVEESVNVTVTA